MAPDPSCAERRDSSRRVRLATLLGSLAIHLGLAALLLHVTKPVVLKPVAPLATEIEVREVESPPPRAASPAAPKPAPATLAHRAGKSRSASRSLGTKPVVAASRPTPSQETPAGTYAGDVPRALDLSLHTQLETASPGGETVHNRAGEIEPEGIRKSVAQARINEWVEEDTATRRVEKGLVDDWFARLDQSLDRALNSAAVPAELPGAVGGALTTRSGLRKYGSAAASYGATGTPGEPGGSPALGEAGNRPDFGPLTQALGPPSMIKIQVDGSSQDPWTVVELKFDVSGKLRDSRVLDSSGNRVFNLHVLHVIALGLPGLADAPDGGFGIHRDGTRSVWRVKGHLSYDHFHGPLSPNDIWYLPLATAVGVATGVNLDDMVGHVTGQPQLHCRVELLQVY